MATRTSQCNLALSHLGNGTTIVDIDAAGEASGEANACRTYLDESVDEFLRDMNPPFATKTQALALVEENPNTEWSYSYRLPSDCLFLRRILSSVRTDDQDTQVKLKIGEDDQGGLIFADQEDAVAEWTFRNTNFNRWPPDARMAHSHLLACYIAPRITNGDLEKKKELIALYQYHLAKARANALNEEKRDREPEAEIIRARYS